MDRWDKIINNKIRQSQPYRPEAKWDKMAAMLDEELPVVTAPIRPSILKKVAWAATFLLIGFTTATMLWWSLDRNQANNHLLVEEITSEEELKCEEDGWIPSFSPERGQQTYLPEKSTSQEATEKNTLKFTKPLPKLKTEKSEGDYPLTLPQGKYRGQKQLAIAPQELDFTDQNQVKSNQSTVFAKSPQVFVSEMENDSETILILDELDQISAPHIILPTIPDQQLNIGKIAINLTKAKKSAIKYANISKDAVSLALGPGVKKKWAKHKWGLELQFSLNRLPKREAYYGTTEEIFRYSYTPITPGIALNLHRRLNTRWEVGLRGGIDGIWFPLEATPADPMDYTEIWGTAYELSVFGKRHLRKNPEKRFRPFMIGSVGSYVMDLGLGGFQEFQTLEAGPSSWSARKKAPEEASQQFDIEYNSQPIKYSYLTGSAGMGVNIRLYRRFSFNYQTVFSGNILLKEEPGPDVSDYWGFNHQWKHSMGMAMSF